ncbi:MAG: surface carbohydrate biosynthesis protein [Planctomycetaceae bacterium]
MHPRTVLFLVPYRARDLDGAALVGHHLKTRHGIASHFTNGYGIPQKLLRHAPDAVVFDHLTWDFKAQEALLAKRLGMKVFLLPTEGLFQEPETAVHAAGKHFGTTAILDGIFSWGHYVRRAILEQGLAEPSRVHLTGCPRFDFYAEPCLSLVASREEFLRGLGFARTDAPLVLWATSTPYVARDRKRIVQRYVRRGHWTLRQIEDELHDEERMFREGCALLRRLAGAHSAWNFVIKVHPAEWAEPYAPFLREFPNVRIAHTEPIRSFLVHCDVLLQRNCTTASEAWMLGKPVVDLEIGDYRIPARAEYKAGSHVVTTLEEAVSAVEACVGGAALPPEQVAAREAFLAEFYLRIDGRAAERCADRIAACLAPPAYDAAAQARKEAAVREEAVAREAREGRRLVNRVKDLLRIPRGVSLRLWKRVLPDEGRSFGARSTTEVEITREMVDDLYQRYESLMQDARA